MATSREEDSDGSDIFWPGYVDATTNLILNLLFLLTILIVAVFMFALELGRSSQVKAAQPETPAIEEVQPVSSVASTDTTIGEETAMGVDPTTGAESALGADPTDGMESAMGRSTNSDDRTAEGTLAAETVAENVALKREIARLNEQLAMLSAENKQAGGDEQVVDATSIVPTPTTGLDKAETSGLEVKIRFVNEAVNFSPEEIEQIREALQPVIESGKARIFVEVPAGFSEAKRLGFYRAMAVRNVLLEMDMANQDIDLLVLEGKSDANAALVRVQPR